MAQERAREWTDLLVEELYVFLGAIIYMGVHEEYHLPSNKIWWYKVEPLASALQASFRQYYSPSSEVSIDQLIVRCFNRYITPPFTPPSSPPFILIFILIP